MKASDIKIGETYLFVATDNPARKHLEGQRFIVEQVKTVWRKVRKRSKKVKRFYNVDGIAARAEELEPLDNFDKMGDAIYKLGNAFEAAANAAAYVDWSKGGVVPTRQASDYKDDDGLPF